MISMPRIHLKNFMKDKSYIWFLLLLLASLTMGCRSNLDEKLGCTDPRSLNYDPEAVFDNGECEYSDSYRYYMPENWSDSDGEGNLLVVNETESPLHLYAETSHLKVIPPKARDFLIDVPVKSDVTQLSLFKAEDVDYVENPPLEKFKSWRVVLGATATVSGPVGWVVSDLVTGDGAGSLWLSYPQAEEQNNRLACNVDVYLHSKTGGRVTSIVPGTNDKEVRLDYGTYRLWFHYWESDPGSSEGYKSLGWKNTGDIVLNASHSNRNIGIPSFDVVPDNAAALKVINRLGATINVKLGDRLIENMVIGREDVQAMSTIAHQDSMVYPVNPDNYRVSYNSLSGSQLGDPFYVDLIQGYMAVLIAGDSYQSLMVENQTSYDLLLGNENYLGVSISAQSTEEVMIPEGLNKVTAFKADSTFIKSLIIENESLTISE